MSLANLLRTFLYIEHLRTATSDHIKETFKLSNYQWEGEE